MKDRARYLPYALAIYFVLVLGAVNILAGLDSRIFVTLFAPTLWLGLYWLGSDHAARERN